MFNTLDSTWDRSARRGWSTLASFGFQAMGVSLLLLVPLVWVQGPPRLSWFDPTRILVPPPAPAPSSGGAQHRAPTSSNIAGGHIISPPSIPDHVAVFDERQVSAAPDLDANGVRGGTGIRGRDGVWGSFSNNVEVAPPPPTPPPSHPIIVSQWAEGGLIYRVQPVYPPLARQARIQGAVKLQAIISKAGTIENLVAVSGHPMLVPAAVNAVRQWRYRPYLLDGQPVEVETEVTVNFVIAAN